MKRWEKYLQTLERFGVRLGLRNITAFLRHVDNPHRKLRAILIGGTNGKGSTASFLAAVLKASGYRVGLYTSPHLHDVRERIRINGQAIPEDRIEDIVSRGRKVVGGRPSLSSVTYFEFVTAVAFLYFCEEKVDLAVVEVGMGGRLDATNLLRPLVSVITTVSMDHEGYLGNTPARIAREKAGIIHTGGSVVTGVWQRDIQEILEKTCRRKKARLHVYGRDFYGRYRTQGRYDFFGRDIKAPGLSLGLRGRHQGRNAGLALASLEVLRDKGYAAGESAISAGMGHTRWPCRLEVIRKDPAIILDGAHNPDGAYALSAALKEEFRWRRFFLVFGVLKDKDYRSMLTWLSPLADRVYLTAPRSDRALPPSCILRDIPSLGQKAGVARDVGTALREAREEAHPEDIICVTGSLFTASAAREFFRRDAFGPPQADSG